MAEGDGAAMRAAEAAAAAEDAAGAQNADPGAGASAPAGPTLVAPPSLAAGAALRKGESGVQPVLDAALVRRVDEDRWLASRFAPAGRRDQLEVLYGFLYEVARTPEVVTEPTLGHVRLTWWRDAVTGGSGGAQGLPAAFKDLIEGTPLDVDRVSALIEARQHDLEAAPFEGWAELEAYVDATAGNAAYLALQICLAGENWPKQAGDCARAVGRAWGFTGLMRAAPIWAARRRTFLPRRLLEHLNLKPEALFAGGGAHVIQQARLAMLDRARFAYLQAKDLARVMPVSAFPAIGYIKLEPLYREKLLAGDDAPKVSLLKRQAKLLTASALGRF